MQLIDVKRVERSINRRHPARLRDLSKQALEIRLSHAPIDADIRQSLTLAPPLQLTGQLVSELIAGLVSVERKHTDQPVQLAQLGNRLVDFGLEIRAAFRLTFGKDLRHLVMRL